MAGPRGSSNSWGGRRGCRRGVVVVLVVEGGVWVEDFPHGGAPLHRSSPSLMSCPKLVGHTSGHKGKPSWNGQGSGLLTGPGRERDDL